MGITRYKRIQNLDVTTTQFDTIQKICIELKIPRAKLLRVLIEVALENPERIQAKIRNPSLFEDNNARSNSSYP